jgi:LysM domain
MASVQLGTRSLAGTKKAVPSDVRPTRPVALTRPLPVPPAPVPPIAPAGRGRPVSDSVLRSGRPARLVAAATVTLAVVAGLSFMAQSTITPEIPVETAVIRVGAGETVWDVARRVAPQSDQRAVVERIQQLNGVVGSAVAPGQELLVPDGRHRST